MKTHPSCLETKVIFVSHVSQGLALDFTHVTFECFNSDNFAFYTSPDFTNCKTLKSRTLKPDIIHIF